ncbi:MAG: hypothetical protein GY909_12150 [Oligoflexia bacterium]|nr:hypothetical protein [Oligoflexia bacterium]
MGIKYFKYILLIFVLISCQNQKPSEIDATSTAVRFSQERARACQNTNFTKDILGHNNIVSLFKCADWVKQFPVMYSSLNSINSKKWDHIFSAVDEKFFNDKEKRERIFGIIKDLDTKGGLAHLSDVLNSLNETNFYDSMYRIFYCSENPNDEKCQDRKDFILNPKELKAYFQYFMFKKEVFQTLSYLTQDFVDSVGDSSQYINAINRVLKDKKFRKIRRHVVKSIIDKFEKGISSEDLRYFEKILTTEVDGEPFLYTWLQNTQTEKVKEILRYPYIGNVEIIPNLIAVKNALENNFVCADRAGVLRISTKDSFDEFMIMLSDGSQKDFFNFLYKNINSIQLGQRFCPVLRNYTVQVDYPDKDKSNVFTADFLKLMGHLGEFFLTQNAFELIKFLQSNSVSNDYLLDFFTGDIFFSVVELSKRMDELSPELTEELVKSIKNFDKNFFKLSNSLGLVLLENETIEKQQAVWKAWNFFTSQEQEFAFRFFDKHFQEGTDFKLLLRFYSKMLFEVSAETEQILGKLFSEPNIDVTMASFQEIFKFLSNNGDPKILSEFKVFFSKDHILKVIEVVSRGININSVDFEKSYILANSEILEKLKIPSKSIKTDLTYWNLSSAAKECLGYLKDNDFHFVLDRGLGPCDQFKEQEVFTSYIGSFYKLNQFLNLRRKTSNGFFGDEYGIFSPRLVSENVTILKLLQKNGYPMKRLFGVLKDSFYEKDKLNEDFSNFAAILSTVNDSLSAFSDDSKDKIYRAISNYSPYQLKRFVSDVLEFSDDYLNREDTFQLVKKDGFSCKEYLNQNIGGFVCPDSKKIERVMDYIVSDLVENHSEPGENIPTALTQLLKSVKVNAGFMIPYDRDEQKKYHMGVIETIEMMSALTNREDKRNQLNVKFLDNDEVYDLFLKDRHEPVRRKHAGDDETEQLMTTMERIETVIRDVRFDSGYLGFHYMNAVSKSLDYSNVVNKKRRLLKVCVPLKFCGKHLNKTQKRLATNSVETFDSLLDANGYEDWKYGDYMKVLLGSLVSSSGKASQISSIGRVKLKGDREIDVPWVGTKKQMKKHNGRILTNVSMLGLFSNMGRILNEYNPDIKAFTARADLKKIDENFLRNIKLNEVIEPLSKTLSIVRNTQRDDLNISYVVSEWVKKLSSENSQKVFEMVFKVLGASIYMGEANFDDQLDSRAQNHHSELNLKNLLDMANEFLPIWQYFEENFPAEYKLEQALPKLYGIVNVLYNDLFSENIARKNRAYNILNTSIRALSFIAEDKKLISEFKQYILKKENYESLVKNIDKAHSLVLSYEKNNELRSLVNTFNDRILNSELIELDGVQAYIGLNGTRSICDSSGNCYDNYHYNELEDILEYLLKDNNKKLSESFDKVFLTKQTETVDFLEKTLKQVELVLR